MKKVSGQRLIDKAFNVENVLKCPPDKRKQLLFLITVFRQPGVPS